MYMQVVKSRYIKLLFSILMRSDSFHLLILFIANGHAKQKYARTWQSSEYYSSNCDCEMNKFVKPIMRLWCFFSHIIFRDFILFCFMIFCYSAHESTDWRGRREKLWEIFYMCWNRKWLNTIRLNVTLITLDKYLIHDLFIMRTIWVILRI